MPVIKVAPALAPLFDEAKDLGRDIDLYFDSLPPGTDQEPTAWSTLDATTQNRAYELHVRAGRWFSVCKHRVIPYVLHDPNFLYYLMREIQASVFVRAYQRPYPERPPTSVSIQDRSPVFGIVARMNDRRMDIEHPTSVKAARAAARLAFGQALSIVSSVPPDLSPLAATQGSHAAALATVYPNTAFILMWMDPAKPELDDVCDGIKSVCQEFEIEARRADDVEHQESITNVILDSIRCSEFLIADLTGERPNVYYEVGYAHSLGKRPILFRSQGTRLHFDLSVHNVPEYKNVRDLKQKLHGRFEAILGRRVGGS